MAKTAKAVRAYKPRKDVEEKTPSLGAVQTKARSIGIGDSERFGGKEETQPDVNWAKLTANGRPIPEFMWSRMSYSQTDQGIAEKRAAAGLNPPRGAVGRERTDYEKITDPDKQLEKYGDDLADDGEFHLSTDPFAPLVKKHVPAGFHGRMMGDRTVKEQGMVRNGVTFKPLMVKNSETGEMERVTAGGMFLAVCSERAWQAQDKYFKDLAKQKENDAIETVREQTDRVMSRADVNQTAKDKRMDDFVSGVQSENIEVVGAENPEVLMHEMEPA